MPEDPRSQADPLMRPGLIPECSNMQRFARGVGTVGRSGWQETYVQGDSSGKEKTHKHKQIWDSPGTGWVPAFCICVILSQSFWGEKHINKIPRKSRDNPAEILFMCFCLFCFCQVGMNGDTFSIKAPKECSKTFVATFKGKFLTTGNVLRIFLLFLGDFGAPL